MKKGIFYIILAIEAILCVMAQLFQGVLPNLYDEILRTPFSQIGMGLRNLSLSGSLGNGIALAIYVTICLLPIVYLLVVCRKRKLFWEDLLLILESILLFLGIYIMINPQKINNIFFVIYNDYEMYKSLFGGMIYSIFIGYLVLRILRNLHKADKRQIFGYLRVLLVVLYFVLCYFVFGELFHELLQELQSIRETNTVVAEETLMVTYFFMIARYLIESIPYLFDMIIMSFLIKLFDDLQKNPSEKIELAIFYKITKMCKVFLVISVLFSNGFQLLELLFGRELLAVAVVIDIPIFSIGFLLGTLFLAQIIEKNQELQEENGLFV